MSTAMGVNLPPPQWIEEDWYQTPTHPVLLGWALEIGYPNEIGFEMHFLLYLNMVDWIKANVVNYKNNALWTKIGDCIYIKLRKPADATAFILRFGSCSG